MAANKRNETGLHGLRTDPVTADDLPYAPDVIDLLNTTGSAMVAWPPVYEVPGL